MELREIVADNFAGGGKMKRHELAGKTVKTKTGEEFTVEDWSDNVLGKWTFMANGNPAALVYAIRVAKYNLPIDHHGVYGKVCGLGVIIHDSEIVRDR